VAKPTITYRSSLYSTSNSASPYTATTAWTPAANSLVVALVVNTATTPADPTVTAHGVSLTRVGTIQTVSTTHKMSLWAGDAGASPTNAAASATVSGTPTGCTVIEFEVTNWNTSLGAAETIFGVNNTANGTATSGSVPVPLFPSAGSNESAIMSFFMHLANEATTGQGGNWTLTAGASGNYNTPASSGAGQHNVTDVAGVNATASWTTSSAWRGLTIQLQGTTALTQPSENIKVSDSVTAVLNPLATSQQEVAKLDDIVQGVVELIRRGRLRITDGPVVAELAEPDNSLTREVTAENIEVSDVVLQLLDPLITSALTENVKVSDTPIAQLDPLQASAQEVVKVSYAVQADISLSVLAQETVKADDFGLGIGQSLVATLDPLEASITEHVKVSDSATPAMFLTAAATENAKVSDAATALLDPLITALLTENVKISDVVTAQLDPLITALLTENVKVSESATPSMALQASVTEDVKVSDVATVVLDPLEALATEHVKVSDAVTASRTLEASTTENVKVTDVLTQPVLVGGGNLSAPLLTENVEVDDIGQGVVQLLGVIHVTDGPVIALIIGEGVYAEESVEVSDAVAAQLLLIQVIVTETVHAVDASDSWAELGTDEYVKVSDTVSAGLTPLITQALTENVKVSDAATAQISLNAPLLTENIKASDAVTALLDTLTASAQENVKVSDALTAQLTVLLALLTESIKVSDAVFAGNDLIVSLSENVKISETLLRTLDPLEASHTESVKVSDAITALTDTLTVSQQENIKVSDAVTVQLTVLQVLLTESVEVAEQLFTGSDLVVNLTEACEVTDVVSKVLDPLEAVPAEAARIADALTAVINLSAMATEVVVVADMVSVARTLEVELTESVRAIEEAPQVVVADASDLIRNLSVVIRVTDEVTAQLETLQIILAEAMAVGDIVTVQRTLRLVTSIAFGDEVFSENTFDAEVFSDPMFGDEELLPQ